MEIEARTKTDGGRANPATGAIAENGVDRARTANDRPVNRFAGMNPVETKLRMLAEAASDCADAYRDDPVRLACRKAKIAQAVSTRFYEETLQKLSDAILRVDQIAHGWEAPWIRDMADPGQNRSWQKFAKLLKLDVKPEAKPDAEPRHD